MQSDSKKLIKLKIAPFFGAPIKQPLFYCHKLDYDDKGLLYFSRSISFFCTATKILLAFISRAAWLRHESRPYMWRKDVLEGHQPFRTNFVSTKDTWTINFAFLPLLVLPAFETAWEVWFFFRRRVAWSWHDSIFRDRTYLVLCSSAWIYEALFVSFRTTESAISCQPLSQVLSLPPCYFTSSAVIMFFYVMRRIKTH